MPYSDVWVPDITLYDSCAEEEMMPGREDYRAFINSSGYVQYNFPTVLKSICRVNVTYFPFDSQLCLLTFGSWSYPSADLDLNLLSPSGDIGVFIRNTEWRIDDLPGTRCVASYNDGTGVQNYTDIRYMLVMKRRPAFYVMTMLFPCILTSAIATVGFLLPSESGEKVSLEVTVLLSLAVFLLVISDFLPPSSDTFPIIGSYFAVSMGLVSLSLLMSVTVLNIHYRGENDKRMPRWLRKLFIERKINILCSRKSQKYPVDEPNNFYRTQDKSNEDTARELEMTNRHGGHSGLCNGRTTHLANGGHHQHAPAASEFVRNVDMFSLHLKNDNTESTTDSNLSEVTRSETETLDSLKRFTMKTKFHDEICSEWQTLARVLDRFFLVLYIIVSVIVSLAFLLQLALHDPHLEDTDPCFYQTQ